MFECISDSSSVASSAALHSSSLPTRQIKALSTINHTFLSTSSSLNEINHYRGQSLDLGRKHVASSSSRNSDIDHIASQASSCGSISDNESWIYDQNSAKYVPQVTKLPSPNREVKEFSLS